MKKLTKLIAVITILLFFTACGSSKKGCGLTAKAEITNTVNETYLV